MTEGQLRLTPEQLKQHRYDCGQCNIKNRATPGERARIKFGQVWLARVEYMTDGRPHNHIYETVVRLESRPDPSGRIAFRDLESEDHAVLSSADMSVFELVRLVHN